MKYIRSLYFVMRMKQFILIAAILYYQKVQYTYSPQELEDKILALLKV